MATHSSVLVWRIPGMGEPDGLPSMGLHRVGHDWSDAAAVWLQSLQITNAGKGVAGNSVSIPGERTKVTRAVEATKPVRHDHWSLHVPELRNKRNPCTATQEKPPHAATRESLRAATQTQRSQKINKEPQNPSLHRKSRSRGIFLYTLMQRTLKLAWGDGYS